MHKKRRFYVIGSRQCRFKSWKLIQMEVRNHPKDEHYRKTI
nr:MAG TPA: hypothetical protein [Caudoviricetes sp.]